MLQYWRSMEQLLDYAKNRDAEHLPAWRAFNKRVGTNGDVGIWHETYRVRAGDYENVYVNMPTFGLGTVGRARRRRAASARARRTGSLRLRVQDSDRVEIEARGRARAAARLAAVVDDADVARVRDAEVGEVEARRRRTRGSRVGDAVWRETGCQPAH